MWGKILSFLGLIGLILLCVGFHVAININFYFQKRPKRIVGYRATNRHENKTSVPPAFVPTFVRNDAIGMCSKVRPNLTNEQYLRASWGHSRSSRLPKQIRLGEFLRVTRNVDPDTMHRPGVLLLLSDNVAETYMLKQFAAPGISVKDWMESKQFVAMEQFNRMGSNSLPNVLPLLTGWSYSRLMSDIWENNHGLSFIFDNFKSETKAKFFAGQNLRACSRPGGCPPEFSPYVTAFAEDCGKHYGTFTFDGTSRGLRFAHTPIVDFSLNSLLERDGVDLYKYCNKRLNGSSANHAFAWVRNLVQLYPNGDLFLFYLSCLTHDANYPFKVFFDELKHTVEYLEALGALDKYLVVVQSDHGMKHRSWSQPFSFVHLPEGFKQQYPLASQMFVENAKRALTSHRDIHKLMGLLVHSCSFYISTTNKRSYDWFCGGPEFDEDNAIRNMRPRSGSAKRNQYQKSTRQARKRMTDSITKDTPFSMFEASYASQHSCRDHGVPDTYCTRMEKEVKPSDKLSFPPFLKAFHASSGAVIKSRAAGIMEELVNYYIHGNKGAVSEGYACRKGLKFFVVTATFFNYPFLKNRTQTARFKLGLRGSGLTKWMKAARWTATMRAPNDINLDNVARANSYGQHSRCVRTGDAILQRVCFCYQLQ